MAPYPGTGTTDTSGWNPWYTGVDTSATNTSAWSPTGIPINSNSSTSSGYYPRTRVIESYLIVYPEYWIKRKRTAFRKLVNERINTRWKVNICKPCDNCEEKEKMDMTQIQSLLLRECGIEDMKKVTRFFKRHLQNG